MTSSEQELDQGAQITDDDLDNRQARIAELHQQIAETESERSAHNADADRQIQATQLDAEIARLEGQLERSKQETAVATDGDAGPLAAAKRQLQQAQEQAKAPSPLSVDTNAADQPEDTTGATKAVEVGSDEEADRVTYTEVTEQGDNALVNPDDNADNSGTNENEE